MTTNTNSFHHKYKSGVTVLTENATESNGAILVFHKIGLFEVSPTRDLNSPTRRRLE